MKMVPTSGDAVLATEATGVPNKGTILLAMGATASMVWWPDALVAALAQGGYRVIRFDSRDTGASTTSAPGDVRYDLSDLAGDLLAVLDAYDVPAAHIVGMSLGAYLAQIEALQHPDRVLSLTLLAAEPLGIAYEGEGIAPEFLEHFGTMGALDWADREAVAAFLLRIAELSAGKAAPFARDEAAARIARELDRASTMQSAFNHSMVGGEIDPALTAAGLTQPVLAIHGSDDPIISINAAQATVAAVDGAQLLVLEGRGHELLLADVPKIAAAILAHCDKASH